MWSIKTTRIALNIYVQLRITDNSGSQSFLNSAVVIAFTFVYLKSFVELGVIWLAQYL